METSKKYSRIWWEKARTKIMTIYYLYGANQGKDFALAEIKSQLLMEREDFKVHLYFLKFQFSNSSKTPRSG